MTVICIFTDGSYNRCRVRTPVGSNGDGIHCIDVYIASFGALCPICGAATTAVVVVYLVLVFYSSRLIGGGILVVVTAIYIGTRKAG